MAKLLVSPVLLCDLLLPGVTSVCLRGIKMLPNGDLELDVFGHDVPEAEKVTAVIQYDWERATPTAKRTVTFQEV